MKKKVLIISIAILLILIVYLYYKLIIVNNLNSIETKYEVSKIQTIRNNWTKKYNYLDLSKYKNRTLGELITLISLKMPYLSRRTSYSFDELHRSGVERNFINYDFYIDSNRILILNVFMPVKLNGIIEKLIDEKKDIFRFIENQKEYYIRQLIIEYKKPVSRYNMINSPETVLPGPNQDPYFRKLDSLKAVLKR